MGIGLQGAELFVFRWMASTGIPPECDLRRCGWRLSRQDDAGPPAEQAVVSILPVRRVGAVPWFHFPCGQSVRAAILLHGVAESADRARYLSLGFGDAVAEDIGIVELDARARRIVAAAAMLPRRRELGPLVLDLVARDAFVRGRAAGLHPREFLLLWRLAETAGTPVGKARLLADVWRLRFAPQTNSLAVHVFRLREKLALAGMRGVIRTEGDGAYTLVIPESPPRRVWRLPVLRYVGRYDPPPRPAEGAAARRDTPI